MRIRLAMGSAVLLAIAFVVNTGFLKSALTDGYEITEIRRFLIPIEDAGTAIESSLGNNERRLSVADMRGILDRQRRFINRHWENSTAVVVDQDARSAGLVDIAIVLKSGSTLVTTADDRSVGDPPAELVEQITAIANGKSLSGLEFVEDGKYYFVPYLLFDDRGRWIVSLVFQFRKNALRQSVAPSLTGHLAPTILVGLVSVFGILLLYFRLAFARRVSRKKDFIFDFVLIMMASLMCSLIVNAVVFERQILALSIDNARETTTEISTRLGDRGAPTETAANRLGFSDTFSLFDSFESIVLTDSRGQPVYQREDFPNPGSEIEMAVRAAVIDRLAEREFSISERLAGVEPGSGKSGTAIIRISKEELFRNSVAMLIKGVTILFITILVMVECLLLYLHLLGQKARPERRRSQYELGFVRPAMFLFLFAIDLSMSFLPLHMKVFDAELFGLSKDVVLSLPISSEFLCVGVFILVAGVWMDRRGWHEPFFFGLLVVALGSLFSWAATDALSFILSRALVGVGYGLALMSAQGLIIRYSGTRSRARGFAALFAGLYSGSICGAAAGAFLAERFGYEKVFLIGVGMVLVLMLFAWRYMRPLIARPVGETRPAGDAKQSVEFMSLLKYLANPVFIALSLLSSLPASVAVAGFLHFFTPVYLDQIGASESTIGQILILYGICLIYFGPSIGRLIDRAQDKKYYMLAGGVLGGLAFATFDTEYGIASMIVSVFLLGLSSSFVLSSQSTIVLELKESQALGEGKALGLFRSISRIGQVIGPIIFGWVLLAGDLTDVINYLGYSYIGAMAILALFVIKRSGNLENRKPALSS